MQADKKSNPRIAHLTTVHAPFDPRIFHKQLRSLRAAGFEPHLIAPHDQSERVHDIPIHALPRPRHRAHRLVLQPALYRRARALDAALYQIHDPELLLLGWMLKKKTGAPVVYDMHEDYRTKGPIVGRCLRGLERWAVRWLDHVLLAEKSYRPIVEGTAVPHTFLPNYFRPIGDERGEPEAEAARSETPTRMLYTGTLAARRGLRTMMDLASLIGEAGRPETIEMVGICHHPDQRAWAERRIHREGLESVVHRTGWDTYVRPSTMPPHYRRADVGLALCEPDANLTGSLLTKFFEYLHYGLPIICSDFPLWRRFVARHECGAVVPPGDAAAVLDVLDTWRAHPERYRQRVANARAAAPEYRWESVEDRLVQVYRRLVKDAVHADRARR
ncbi:MAG: glycosyltransferase [Salinivenus sp.]